MIYMSGDSVFGLEPLRRSKQYYACEAVGLGQLITALLQLINQTSTKLTVDR